ncbi:MAG TPA: kelch repeat-containing protein [Ktedonobacteraceae bacterium]|nr:kelch repeat-containing protein [Ktedonobacteraceae bacterium]
MFQQRFFLSKLRTKRRLPIWGLLIAAILFFGALARGSLHLTRAASTLSPATAGNWTPTGSLHQGRGLHTATLLPNGRVLITGGSFDDLNALTSAELYDPATGTWTATGSLHQARALHTATLLPNGQVLVAGGFAANEASAELYDPPATPTPTPTGKPSPTPTPRPNPKGTPTPGCDPACFPTPEAS